MAAPSIQPSCSGGPYRLGTMSLGQYNALQLSKTLEKVSLASAWASVKTLASQHHPPFHFFPLRSNMQILTLVSVANNSIHNPASAIPYMTALPCPSVHLV